MRQLAHPRSNSPRLPRRDASSEALKLLAVTRSAQLCSLVNALFEIGLRGRADASSAELALINLADLMVGQIGQPRQIEHRR
jgi:hypothetical protein